MSVPFHPSQSTAERLFRETNFSADTQPQPGGVRVAVQAPPATVYRVQRLDVTARTRSPGVDVDWRGVGENVRMRLLGAMAAATWRHSDHRCIVLRDSLRDPEFDRDIRRELIEQFDLADQFVHFDQRTAGLEALARDFCDWLQASGREDGGVMFERLGTDVLAMTPPAATFRSRP